MEVSIWLWVLFNLFVLAMLALDLGVFHKKTHVVSVKEALAWTFFWIVISLIFCGIIYYWQGTDTALKFLTGYLLEKSLSVDNIFVFLVIFTYFGVPSLYQHKILFWGILGALLFRAIFIFAGITLIHHFHWIMYVFGAFLVFTGGKLAFQNDEEVHPEKNPVLKIFRRLVPVTKEYHGDKFVIKKEGRRFATPLLVVLVVVETTDVIFAVDSIPAILAITLDPFIVYTSNVFAILGLRALYFAIAGLMRMFRFLNYGLSGILVFIGVKMLLIDIYEFPTALALGVIATILMISIIASIFIPHKKSKLENEIEK